MKEKITAGFIINLIFLLIVTEAGLLLGAFYCKTLPALALASMILIALAIAASSIAARSLRKNFAVPLTTLANKMRGYGIGSNPVDVQDPIAYIDHAAAEMRVAVEDLSGKVTKTRKFFESLLKASTTNTLIDGIALGLAAIESLNAGVVMLVDKQRELVSLYPLFPEGIVERKEIPLGKDGIPFEEIKLRSSAVKDRLPAGENLNALEKLFLEKGYNSSFVVPIINESGFFGLLGIASKKEAGIAKEDLSFIEGSANLIGIRLANLKMNQELRQKTSEVIELKHAGKDMIEKQLNELKSMYNQVVQAGKMASLGQLSAGVAHELNNPIGGILGYTQLILAKLKDINLTRQDIADCVRYLEMMERESKRCQWIVSNLLNFSRKPLDERMPLDLKDVIDNTISMMEFQLAKSNVKCNVTYPPEGMKKINGNSNELQQVFTNLFQNALDAMPDGGTLTIAAKNKIDERYRPPFEYIEIVFTDTGYGMPQENLSRIFEPFFSDKVGKPGTGLGLSISYTIVNSHDGIIKVDSEMGKGTTFTVILPVIKKATP